MLSKNKLMKKTLVLGASLKSARYSNLVMHRLVEHGHPLKAIGLKAGVVAGVMIGAKKEMFDDIDTVTLYLNAKRQTEYYSYIIALNPKRVIFNPGTENPEFYKLLAENGIEVDLACSLVLLSTNQY